MRTVTHVLRGVPDATSPEIAAAACVLKEGGLVAFPTETVYGLGADALDGHAVAKIFAAKGRPATNPVIVHVSSVEQARTLSSAWPAAADRLAEAFWPGPLTLIVPKAACIPDVVTAGGPSVALRMPSHPVARALLAAAGVPVAAPSANLSETLSSTSAAHVLKGLDGRIDMILDGGPAQGGLESTVVDLSVEPALIRRPGLVSAEALAPFGIVAAASGIVTTGVQVSPGQHARHYAPKIPLSIVSSLHEGLEENVGYLLYGRHAPSAAVVEVLPDDPVRYATGLYAALHRLEDADIKRIVVLEPPRASGWEAVHDRLTRASSSAA